MRPSARSRRAGRLRASLFRAPLIEPLSSNLLRALDELQELVALSEVHADAWIERIRAEREAGRP